jgi:hypothetical protein
MAAAACALAVCPQVLPCCMSTGAALLYVHRCCPAAQAGVVHEHKGAEAYVTRCAHAGCGVQRACQPAACTYAHHPSSQARTDESWHAGAQAPCGEGVVHWCAHLRRQLEAQQVLGCRCEEEVGGAGAGLELRGGQVGAQLVAAGVACGGGGGHVVWCGVVWCGVVWCGVVWCGVVWCGVVWCGVVCDAWCESIEQEPWPVL